MIILLSIYVIFLVSIFTDLIVTNWNKDHGVAIWTSLLISCLWPMWAVLMSRNVFSNVDIATKEYYSNIEAMNSNKEKETSDDTK